MTPGFIKPYPDFRCPQLDGQNFQLLDNLDGIDSQGRLWRCMKGSTTDGPSEPQIVDAVISPFGFGIWGPSLFHDAGFRCTLLRWQVMENGPQVLDERYGDMAGQRGEFIPADHDAQMIDDLFNDFMQICGMPTAQRITVYNAVKYAGGRAFEKDLSLPLPKMSLP